MKLHVTKSGVVSNFPIKEMIIDSNGKKEVFESTDVDISENDFEAIKEGEKEFEFLKSGKPQLVGSNKKAEIEAARLSIQSEKQAAKEVAARLKKKLEKGEATLEEVQKTLANLL
jgi:DUF438 domain-containing protein